MQTPLVIMIHRVKTKNCGIEIAPIYYQRKMVVEEAELFALIDGLITTNHHIGTIEEAVKNSHVFHITFDDGFKEHLTVAEHLKAKYNFHREHVTFAINVGNSCFRNYSGMDVIYKIIDHGQIRELLEYLSLQPEYLWEKDFSKIKEKILSFTPEQFRRLHQNFFKYDKQLDKIFLNKDEIPRLSLLFDIMSHGMTHRDLRYHPQISRDEIGKSKKILDDIIGRKITKFCYPEGKNDYKIQEYCKENKYDLALSIRHEKNNAYCIGRLCIGNHKEEIMRHIDG